VNDTTTFKSYVTLFLPATIIFTVYLSTNSLNKNKMEKTKKVSHSKKSESKPKKSETKTDSKKDAKSGNPTAKLGKKSSKALTLEEKQTITELKNTEERNTVTNGAKTHNPRANEDSSLGENSNSASNQNGRKGNM
jgi:hypothetical protein